MATYCLGYVRGRRMRATALDECGAPFPAGTENAYAVTKGFVSVAVEVDVEDGDEFVVKNADGDLCINDRSKDQIKRLNLTFEFCQVDPGLFYIVTGMEMEVDIVGEGAVDVVGFRLKEGATDANFALEVWSGVNNAQCVAGQDPVTGYNLFPYVTNGILQSYTIENDAATFEITAWTQSNPLWAEGPWNVIRNSVGTPTPLAVPVDATTHLVLRRTTLAPPAPFCGARVMPGESS